MKSYQLGANVLVRRVALLAITFISLLGFSQSSAFASGSVTLSWTAVSDPSVAGYRIYYGVASRTYTNVMDVGTNTTVTISNLVNGVTYYFAATCYNVLGMESSYSAETTYTVPGSVGTLPPTLNSLANILINENPGLQTVNLSGITSGAGNAPGVTVTASSSNTGLVPNPSVQYTSPNTAGTITFTPVANAFGSATVTVTVNNGLAVSNTVSQTFTVTVDAPPHMSAITTNLTIATNTSVGPIAFTISDPDTALSGLTLRATSSSSVLIPTNNIVFGGSGSNRTVTLTPLANQSGTATIAIVLSDGMVSVSNVFQLNVLTAPPAPLSLTIIATGQGNVITNAIKLSSGGLKYTLSAVPAAGQLFVGWQGGVVSKTSKINVLVTNAVVLHAVFIANPFTPIQGNYSGLFYEGSAIQLRSAGYFTMVVSGKGTYSGKLQLAGKHYSVSGQLSMQTLATNQIKLPDGSMAVLTFGFEGEVVSGLLTADAWQAGLQGDRAVYNLRSNPAPFAGTYTLVVPGQNTNAAEPMGSGYGSVKIDGNGVARFAGVLADGTKVSQSTTLSREGQWPLYASLYSGKGLVISWLTLSNGVSSDLSGALSWIKSAGAVGSRYSGGFTDECVAVGSAYTVPVAPAGILNFTTGQAVFTGGDLGAGFNDAITLAGSQATGTGVSVSFSLSSGIFTGRTTDASSGLTYSFGGAVLQKSNAGYGFLLGATQSSEVALTP